MHSYIGYIHMCYAPMYHLSLVEQCQHTSEIRKKMKFARLSQTHIAVIKLLITIHTHTYTIHKGCDQHLCMMQIHTGHLVT